MNDSVLVAKSMESFLGLPTVEDLGFFADYTDMILLAFLISSLNVISFHNYFSRSLPVMYRNS